MAKKGNPIPTKFEPKTQQMLDVFCDRFGMDRSELIRRCVETALARVEATGDYRFLIETDNLSLVAEDPGVYHAKRKRKKKLQ